MLVTALAPKIGYDQAANIAKKALKNKTTLKNEVLKSGLLNEKEYQKNDKEGEGPRCSKESSITLLLLSW